jgi:hypothetical protein
MLLAFMIHELPEAGRRPAAAGASLSFGSSHLRIFEVTVGASQLDSVCRSARLVPSIYQVLLRSSPGDNSIAIGNYLTVVFRRAINGLSRI